MTTRTRVAQLERRRAKHRKRADTGRMFVVIGSMDGDDGDDEPTVTIGGRPTTDTPGDGDTVIRVVYTAEEIQNPAPLSAVRAAPVVEEETVTPAPVVEAEPVVPWTETRIGRAYARRGPIRL